MRFLTATAFIGACALLLTAASASARVWTSGKFTLEAKYVSTTEDGLVYLKTPDGSKVVIERKKLSKADIEFIEREFEAEQNPFQVVEESPFKPAESAEAESAKAADSAPLPSQEASPSQEAAPAEASAAALSPVPAGKKAGEQMVQKINGVEFAFRWCPAARFEMGSPLNEVGREGNETPHAVNLLRGFWMLETEVTQAQWNAIFESNPSRFKAPNRPVDSVTWGDCAEFCEKFSQELGMKAQLPTEAQWEYACRAGTRTPFSFGSALNGNLAVCDGEEPYGMTERGVELRESAPVKTREPNPWGLYDMHGNVSEWCADWYARRVSGEAVTDPTGPASGKERVVRGGSWDDDPEDCRSASRDEESPRERDSDRGFRFILP